MIGQIVFWSAMIVTGVIVEFISFQMISIWFAISAVVSLILACCGVEVWIQIVVFAVLSLVLIACTRKLVKKMLSKAEGKTNLDLLHNKTEVLLSDITDTTKGTVKVNGVVWNVTSKDGEPISKGSKVIVVKNEGNTLIVEKEKK